MKNLVTLVAFLVICSFSSAQKKEVSDIKVKNDQAGSDKKDQTTEVVHITPESSGVKRSIGYKFSEILKDEDPGVGLFRFNTDNLSDITYLFVDNIDISGEDQTKWYSTWDKETGASGRGGITLADSDGKVIIVLYFTDVFIDGTGFWKLPVKYISGTLPRDGMVYFYVFDRIAHKDEAGKVDQSPVASQDNPVAEVVPEVIVNPVTEEVPIVIDTPVAEVVPEVIVNPVTEEVPVVVVTPVTEVVTEVTVDPVPELIPVVTVTTEAEPVLVLADNPVPEVEPVVAVTPVAEVVPAVTVNPVTEGVPVIVVNPITEAVPEDIVNPVKEVVSEVVVAPVADEVPEVTVNPVPEIVQVVIADPVPEEVPVVVPTIDETVPAVTVTPVPEEVPVVVQEKPVIPSQPLIKDEPVEPAIPVRKEKPLKPVINENRVSQTIPVVPEKPLAPEKPVIQEKILTIEQQVITEKPVTPGEAVGQTTSGIPASQERSSNTAGPVSQTKTLTPGKPVNQPAPVFTEKPVSQPKPATPVNPVNQQKPSSQVISSNPVNQTYPVNQGNQRVPVYEGDPVRQSNEVYQGSRLPSYQDNYAPVVSKRRKCYRGIIEVGYAAGVGDYGLNNFRFNFINGFRIGQISSLGLGIGYRRYFTENSTLPYLASGKSQVPVFIDLRTTFSNRKVTPYIAIDLGGTARPDTTASKQDGLYFSTSGGIWFNLSDRFAVFAGIAYEMLKLEFSDTDPFINNYKKNSNSVSLNIGISF